MPRETLDIEFAHGLGDSVHFAFMLPLWIKRGYKLRVRCHREKAILFMAAGADILDQGGAHHAWLHPPSGAANWRNHWSQNKAGWNLEHSGVLPHIGTHAELWDEYLAVRLDMSPLVSQDVRNKVDTYLAKLERPITLVHTTGDNVGHMKNYPDQHTRRLYDLLPGSVLILDWSKRSPKGGKAVYLADDYGWISLAELWRFMDRADLLIGIDSGPAMFARYTRIPAVVLWHRHLPCHYVLPRDKTINITAHSQKDWIQRRRVAYNLIENEDTIMPKPEFVADVCKSVLSFGVGQTMLADLTKRQLPGPYLLGAAAHYLGNKATVLVGNGEDWQEARKLCQGLPIELVGLPGHG